MKTLFFVNKNFSGVGEFLKENQTKMQFLGHFFGRIGFLTFFFGARILSESNFVDTNDTAKQYQIFGWVGKWVK